MIHLDASRGKLLALLAGAWMWLETFRKSRTAAVFAVLLLPVALLFAGIGYFLFYIVKSIARLVWRIVSFPFVVVAQAVTEFLELVRQIVLFPIRLVSRVVEAVFETLTTLVLFPFRLVCALLDSVVAMLRSILFLPARVLGGAMPKEPRLDGGVGSVKP